MSRGPITTSHAACPYLGIQHDSAIHYGFPVLDNLCYAEKTVVSIALDHQGHYCLSDAHGSCPFYQEAASRHAPSAAALAEVTGAQVTRKQRALSALLFFALGVCGMLATMVLILWATDAAFVGRLFLTAPAAAADDQPRLTLDASPMFTATPTSTATVTQSPSPVVTPTRTPTRAPTATATRTQPPPRAAVTGSLQSPVSAGIICTPAPTPLPTPFLIVAVPALNLREQTAANASVIQVAYAGDRLAVTGRDATADWVQTCCLGGWPGWVMVRHVNLSVPVRSLPVVPTAAVTKSVAPSR